MAQRHHCRSPRRLEMLRRSSALNGIEFLEVLDGEAVVARVEPGSLEAAPVPAEKMRQRTLMVRFVHELADAIDTGTVVLEGGVRLTNIRVQWAWPADRIPADHVFEEEGEAYREWADARPERTLVVRLASWGDFDTYRLCIRFASDAAAYAAGFDPRSLCIDFNFKVECPTALDCRVEHACPELTPPSPEIDYLEKDFEGFRRVMLDRLARTSPRWIDRNPGDLGITLVELLAYAADHLSYYQDAVATEAYLGTARQRISLRRHARSLDYFIDEGANARAWVTLEVDEAVEVLRGERFWTRVAEAPPAIAPGSELLELRTRAGVQVFEAIDGLRAIPAHNEIHVHTWEDDDDGPDGDCCLPRGATSASLARPDGTGGLELEVGDVIVLEEVHPRAGARTVDAQRRHAVRLTSVRPARDFLLDVKVLEVSWSEEDVLPFPFSLRRVLVGDRTVPTTVVRGNTVLVDHGETVGPIALPAVPDRGAKKYRPRLELGPLTHRRHVPAPDGASESLYDRSRGATDALQPRNGVFLPSIRVTRASALGEEIWTAARDLLSSGPNAREFVVEIDDSERARLRFGDGTHGRLPPEGEELRVIHRVGQGRIGNVGAEAIAHYLPTERSLAVPDDRQPWEVVTRVRNVLPARGGRDPQTATQIKRLVPGAFRHQRRAVTADDYARVVGEEPDVQRACATIRYTGSWSTVFVTIDRLGDLPVDDEGFRARILAKLESHRMAGYDVELEEPVRVPLDISMTVCVEPGHPRSRVQAALWAELGPRRFFHPDRFTLGQPVHLSQLVAAAMSVPGVRWVDLDPSRGPHRFHRLGQLPRGEYTAGKIEMGRTEVAQLAADPNHLERGRLELHLEGGL